MYVMYKLIQTSLTWQFKKLKKTKAIFAQNVTSFIKSNNTK